MQVETFEVTEVDASGAPLETSAECLELIEKLGLDGQKGLVGKDDNDEKTVVPYRRMTKEEVLVYQVLCPGSTSVERYDGGPMPLRVLQVLAHARSLNYFKRIVVWAAETPDVKDPVLVGCLDEYNRDFFILARWGEMLAPFEELRKKAAELLVELRRTKLMSRKAVLAQVEAELETLPGMGTGAILARAVEIVANWDDPLKG